MLNKSQFIGFYYYIQKNNDFGLFELDSAFKEYK